MCWFGSPGIIYLSVHLPSHLTVILVLSQTFFRHKCIPHCRYLAWKWLQIDQCLYWEKQHFFCTTATSFAVVEAFWSSILKSQPAAYLYKSLHILRLVSVDTSNDVVHFEGINSCTTNSGKLQRSRLLTKSIWLLKRSCFPKFLIVTRAKN